MDWSDLDPAFYWLIGAALLAATELAVPGVFLVWVAAAALLTSLLTFVTGVGFAAQLAMFGFSAIAMVLIGRQAYARMAHVTTEPLLNERAAQLIGRTVTVALAIRDGQGRVKVGDGIWPARGADADEGSRVRITGVDGACLLVDRIEELGGPHPKAE